MNTFLHWILCLGILVCPIQCFAGGLEISFAKTEQISSDSDATGVGREGQKRCSNLVSSQNQGELSDQAKGDKWDSCVGCCEEPEQSVEALPKSLKSQESSFSGQFFSYFSIQVQSAGGCGCCEQLPVSGDRSGPGPFADSPLSNSPLSDTGCGCACVCSGVVLSETIDLPDFHVGLEVDFLLPVVCHEFFNCFVASKQNNFLPNSYGKSRRFMIQSLQI